MTSNDERNRHTFRRSMTILRKGYPTHVGLDRAQLLISPYQYTIRVVRLSPIQRFVPSEKEKRTMTQARVSLKVNFNQFDLSYPPRFDHHREEPFPPRVSVHWYPTPCDQHPVMELVLWRRSFDHQLQSLHRWTITSRRTGNEWERERRLLISSGVCFKWKWESSIGRHEQWCLRHQRRTKDTYHSTETRRVQHERTKTNDRCYRSRLSTHSWISGKYSNGFLTSSICTR